MKTLKRIQLHQPPSQPQTQPLADARRLLKALDEKKFALGRDDDAVKFLTALFAHLQGDILSQFGVSEFVKLTCTSCLKSHVSIHFQGQVAIASSVSPIIILALGNVKGIPTLTQLWNNHYGTEIVELRCRTPACSKNTLFLKETTVQSIPNYLIVTFKRFQYLTSGTTRKISAPVVYMPSETFMEKTKSVSLDLLAVVCHLGESLEGVHYGFCSSQHSVVFL